MNSNYDFTNFNQSIYVTLKTINKILRNIDHFSIELVQELDKRILTTIDLDDQILFIHTLGKLLVKCSSFSCDDFPYLQYSNLMFRITFRDDEENLKHIYSIEYMIIKMNNYTNLDVMVNLIGTSFLENQVPFDILIETLTNNFNLFTQLIDNYGFGFETLVECLQLNYNNLQFVVILLCILFENGISIDSKYYLDETIDHYLFGMEEPFEYLFELIVIKGLLLKK